MPSPLGQSTAQVPVGAVVSSCYVAVDLQSSLVVYVCEPVTLQSLVGSSAAKQRLYIEREQLQRPESKYVQLRHLIKTLTQVTFKEQDSRIDLISSSIKVKSQSCNM